MSVYEKFHEKLKEIKKLDKKGKEQFYNELLGLKPASKISFDLEEITLTSIDVMSDIEMDGSNTHETKSSISKRPKLSGGIFAFFDREGQIAPEMQIKYGNEILNHFNLNKTLG